MTAPRLVARASRSRFLVGLGILILMVGFVAIFHSSQQQLDQLRNLSIRCEQQQEAISAKMQVVVDQKLRLENTLQSERLVHEQNRVELQHKVHDEKEQHTKADQEANIRYASLQQHYNLMKSQLDDLTEECSKSKRKQHEEVNSLQRKVSELQGMVALHHKESASDVEQLKAQLAQAKQEKVNLESAYRQKLAFKEKTIESLKKLNEKMEKENSQYIELCKIPPGQMPHHYKAAEVFEQLPPGIPNSGPLRSFAEQISIIPKPLPLVFEDESKKQSNNQNVLQQPQLLKTSTSISSALNKKTSERNSNLQVPILAAPTVVSPEGGKSSSSTTSTTTTSSGGLVKKPVSKHRSKALPEGVVPFPESMEDLMKTDENNSENAINNRYQNAASHQSLNANGGADKRSRNDKDLNFMNANVELENGAQEVDDFNLGGGGGGAAAAAANNNQLQQPNVKDNGENMNAAEEDTNLYEQKLFANQGQGQQQQHGGADYNEVHHHGGGGKGAGIGEKLINEIARDHGKEGDNYPNEMEEDLHLDGQQEAEEEGDVGEYDDPTALKQGHAERN
uniref:Putative conserved secreted protein n=1 Tax=Culex tarsalis TaxID=7177 RepID=A0A1Q3F4P3_CULTA